MAPVEVDPYEVMALVYDRWMEHDGAPYEQWCGFIDAACRHHDREVTTILEVGCGTGAMTQMLYERGYEVTAVDASAHAGESATKIRALDQVRPRPPART